MPIFTYFAVVGSVMIALLFVVDPMLEKGTRAVVTSQYGLPERPVVTSDQYGLEKPRRPDPKQVLAAVPAPAPDMTSPLVLAAQPKAESVPEVLAKVEPAALAARAEAHLRRSVSPAGSRQSTTDRSTSGRNTSRGAESSACQAVTDFLSLLVTRLDRLARSTRDLLTLGL